jgi:hypothetical protein
MLEETAGTRRDQAFSASKSYFSAFIQILAVCTVEIPVHLGRAHTTRLHKSRRLFESSDSARSTTGI